MGPWPFGEYLMNYVRLGRGELRCARRRLRSRAAVSRRFRAITRPPADGLAARARLVRRPRGAESQRPHGGGRMGGSTSATSSWRCGPPPAGPKSVQHNVWFLWLPLFEDVRRAPAFKRFIEDSGLVDYWRLNEWPRACRAVGSDDFECD